MKAAISYVIASVLFVAIGGAVGWYIAAHDAPTAQAHDHGGGHDEHDDHDDHDHGDDDDLVHLSPEAMKNAGMGFKRAVAADFWVSERVPAVIAETPASDQPLTAPVAGIVTAILPELGEVVAADSVAVTLLRDALPRPSLGLTEEMLKPATENYHVVKAELRKALTGLKILQTELARLETVAENQVAGLPVLPRQDLINLSYEKARAEQEVANLRNELRLHGLTPEQVTAVESGQEVDLNLQIWRTVLRRNGIWSDLAEQTLAALPADMQLRPWVIASIGELATQDLLGTELLDWFAKRPEARKQFLHVAGFLLEGQSLPAIQRLEALGALEPIVSVRIPTSAPDWDVHRLSVKVGDHVDEGQTLLVLGNARKVYLEARPVGAESVAMLAALKNDWPMTASPLVPDAAPTLNNLRLQSIVGADGDRSIARISVDNQVRHVTSQDQRAFRSWALQTGQRFMLHVPTKKLANVITLPAEAVIDNGAEKIVYLVQGDAFKPTPVVVAYADHDSVVLSPDNTTVKPGDPIIVKGAFLLDLAAKTAGGAPVDPHAGHSH